MLTVVIVAHTYSQYQAFIRRWFEHIRSSQNMQRHFIWIAPMDSMHLSKLDDLRGGIYFPVSDANPELAAMLKAKHIHRAEITEPF